MLRLIAVVLLVISAPAIAAKTCCCTTRNSERATVPQIVADPEKYAGRCVVVEGVMQRMFLFESVDGVYLQARDSLDPTSSGFRLGLDNMSGRFSDRYQRTVS